MANLRFNLVRFDDESTLTVFHEGKPLVATDSHPNWAAILKGVTVDDDPSVVDLFDPAVTIAKKFERLSERVAVQNGRVFFDGDEVNNSLTEKIVQCLEEGIEDWEPLVAFFEKVYDNPVEDSRNQLFDFLAHNKFTINEDGDIVGYKGVVLLEEDNPKQYRSSASGTDEVSVNGEVSTGYVFQSDGDVVEMARSAVHHDPNTGCSHGLHVANYEYAKGYGTVLMVLVNPRDVVSVPNDHYWQKVRVCRYRVVGPVDAPLSGALRVTEPEPEDDDRSWEWGSDYYDDSGYSW